MVTLKEANSLWNNSSLSCLVVLKWNKNRLSNQGKEASASGEICFGCKRHNRDKWTTVEILSMRSGSLLTVRTAHVSLWHMKTAQKMSVNLNDNPVCRKDYKNLIPIYCRGL